MFYKQFFINKMCDPYLVIGSTDEEDLRAEQARNEKNIAVEMDALTCLRFFPQIEKLILLPGQIDRYGLDSFDKRSVAAIKLDYFATEYGDFTIDMSQFLCLELVFSRDSHNIYLLDQCKNLCTLSLETDGRKTKNIFRNRKAYQSSFSIPLLFSSANRNIGSGGL